MQRTQATHPPAPRQSLGAQSDPAARPGHGGVWRHAKGSPAPEIVERHRLCMSKKGEKTDRSPAPAILSTSACKLPCMPLRWTPVPGRVHGKRMQIMRQPRGHHACVRAPTATAGSAHHLLSSSCNVRGEARRGAARRVHVQTSTRVMHNNRFKGNTVRRMSGREREGKTW